MLCGELKLPGGQVVERESSLAIGSDGVDALVVARFFAGTTCGDHAVTERLPARIKRLADDRVPGGLNDVVHERLARQQHDLLAGHVHRQAAASWAVKGADAADPVSPRT